MFWMLAEVTVIPDIPGCGTKKAAKVTFLHLCAILTKETVPGNLESVLPAVLDPRDTQNHQLLACKTSRFLDAERHLGSVVDKSEESGKNHQNRYFLSLSDFPAPS